VTKSNGGNNTVINPDDSASNKVWHLKGAMLEAMSAKDKADLAPLFSQATYAPKSVIFARGDPADRIYLVMSGHVRLYLVHESGKEISLALLGPGDIFGELALLGEVRQTRFAQATDTVVLRFAPASKFLEAIAARPRLKQQIAAIIGHRVIQAELQIENLAYTSLHGRVLAVLLYLADHFGEPVDGGIEISLRLSQQDLASFAGTTRESWSTELHRLVRSGTISLTGDHHIVIRNRNRLRPGLSDRLRTAFRIPA
jgi:CRP/FNR family transcriptional regulator, cyclic AMP receptor protein